MTGSGPSWPATRPPQIGEERGTLLAYLERQRSLVRWKLEGLPDDVARRVDTASGLTVHWIVEHLADAERVWIRVRFAGELSQTEHEHWPRHHGDARLVDLLDGYREESRLCNAVIAAHSLDDLDLSGERNLRGILAHLIEETARHIGHLDLLCELADGRAGEEP